MGSISDGYDCQAMKFESMRPWSLSGDTCKPSYSTLKAGAPEQNWLQRSSVTSKYSTTGNDAFCHIASLIGFLWMIKGNGRNPHRTSFAIRAIPNPPGTGDFLLPLFKYFVAHPSILVLALQSACSARICPIRRVRLKPRFLFRHHLG